MIDLHRSELILNISNDSRYLPTDISTDFVDRIGFAIHALLIRVLTTENYPKKSSK